MYITILASRHLDLQFFHGARESGCRIRCLIAWENIVHYTSNLLNVRFTLDVALP